MIRLIEAYQFRCLQYIRQELQDFHVLVGPNASGKTTFLDTVAFLGDLVSGGLDQAISTRTQNFQDLVWKRQDGRFELAIEVAIPPDQQSQLQNSDFDTIRYEVAIEQDVASQETLIAAEKVLLKKTPPLPVTDSQGSLLDTTPLPETIISGKSAGSKTVVNKFAGGNDNFYDESDKGWDHAFKLGPRKSALGNLPEDESKFPVSTWLKGILTSGIQNLILNSMLMRNPSPPGKSMRFRPDGSNLPWVIDKLKTSRPEQYLEWLNHLRTALPDLHEIETIQRPEDRHMYLMLGYDNGLKIPSWTASDGTLRLLALTLPAYLDDLEGIYLIEEPENGVHPMAIETIFQSLSSTYSAQILLATHSPVLVSIAEPRQILCFSKDDQGATRVVRGDLHPSLKDWRGDPNLSVLFAGGVLG